MIAKKKHSSLYCIISIVVTSLFVLRAFYFTHYEVQITSDTLEYYYNFKHIEDYLFPYGIEIVLPLSMMFVKLFGGDFNVYLFFCLLLWGPLIFYTVYISCHKPLLFIVLFFFFTPYFYTNAILIVRQYMAAVFYLYCLYFSAKSYNKLATILGLLSIFSHFYAITWMVFSSSKFIKLVLNDKLYKIIFPSLALILFLISNIHLDSIAAVLLQFNLPEVLQRKIVYYYYTDNLIQRASYISMIFSCLVFSLSAINIYARKKDIILKVSSVMLFSSFFYILLSQNIVSASRFGFWSYYFSIPSIILLVYFAFSLREK